MAFKEPSLKNVRLDIGNVYIVRTQLWGEGGSGLCILGCTRGRGDPALAYSMLLDCAHGRNKNITRNI